MKYAKSEATFTEHSIKIEVVGRGQSIIIWDHFNQYSKLRVIYNAQLKADFLVRALNMGIERANQVLLDDAIAEQRTPLVSESLRRFRTGKKLFWSAVALVGIVVALVYGLTPLLHLFK